MRTSDIVTVARAVSMSAHGAIGQLRKYTGEPYFVHPAEVVFILREHGITDPEMLAAAYMHDVLEDTKVTKHNLMSIFGPTSKVVEYVVALSDMQTPSDGNRATRKANYLAQLVESSAEVQTIKLADMISNTSSIVQFDPGFAKTYMVEKRQMVEALVKADRKIYQRAKMIVDDYFKQREIG